MKLQAHKIGLAGALFAAVTMLLLSVLHSIGLYKGAAVMMQQWHMFYEPSTIIGTIAGMIEAAIITYLLILLFGWIYSMLEKRKSKE